jgi:hypothetical protein
MPRPLATRRPKDYLDSTIARNGIGRHPPTISPPGPAELDREEVAHGLKGAEACMRCDMAMTAAWPKS